MYIIMPKTIICALFDDLCLKLFDIFLIVIVAYYIGICMVMNIFMTLIRI